MNIKEDYPCFIAIFFILIAIPFFFNTVPSFFSCMLEPHRIDCQWTEPFIVVLNLSAIIFMVWFSKNYILMRKSN